MAGFELRRIFERRRFQKKQQPLTGGSLGASSGVKVRGGKQYQGGYDDASVEGMAVEDGNSSFQDESVWGENTGPRVIQLLNSTVGVLRHLVGHAFRDESLPLEVELERTVPGAQSAEQDALDDIEDEEDARREENRVSKKTWEEGLSRPQREDNRRYVAKLGTLVAGDLVFIAVAFQVFGLSDRLLLGLIPFSSELYFAALSSVLALLFLAHHGGEELKLISHTNRRRREATTEDVPALGIGTRIYAGIWIAGAALVLGGISAVRETYLVDKGVDAHTEVFVAIQGGAFLAALAISISHAHPYAREWARASHWMKRAVRQSRRSAGRHAELVSHVNGLIDQRLALLAMAAQHARLGETDAARQALLYVRRTQLSQPEPVGDRLFSAELPAPSHPSDEDLQSLILGIAELPQFDRLDTDAVTSRREQLRKTIVALRRRIDPEQDAVGKTGSAQLQLDNIEELTGVNGSGRS
jgi:hypothetical protein